MCCHTAHTGFQAIINSLLLCQIQNKIQTILNGNYSGISYELLLELQWNRRQKSPATIGLDNGLVPLGNTPVTKPMLTRIYVTIWRQTPQTIGCISLRREMMLSCSDLISYKKALVQLNLINPHSAEKWQCHWVRWHLLNHWQGSSQRCSVLSTGGNEDGTNSNYHLFSYLHIRCNSI